MKTVNVNLSIKELRLKPSDILVLHSDVELDPEIANRLHNQMRTKLSMAGFPMVQVVVTDPGLRIGVIKKVAGDGPAEMTMMP